MKIDELQIIIESTGLALDYELVNLDKDNMYFTDPEKAIFVCKIYKKTTPSESSHYFQLWKFRKSTAEIDNGRLLPEAVTFEKKVENMNSKDAALIVSKISEFWKLKKSLRKDLVDEL